MCVFVLSWSRRFEFLYLYMCLIGDGGDGSVGIIVLLSLLFHVPAVAAATTT